MNETLISLGPSRREDTAYRPADAARLYRLDRADLDDGFGESRSQGLLQIVPAALRCASLRPLGSPGIGRHLDGQIEVLDRHVAFLKSALAKADALADQLLHDVRDLQEDVRRERDRAGELTSEVIRLNQQVVKANAERDEIKHRAETLAQHSLTHIQHLRDRADRPWWKRLMP